MEETALNLASLVDEAANKVLEGLSSASSAAITNEMIAETYQSNIADLETQLKVDEEAFRKQWEIIGKLLALICVPVRIFITQK